MNKSRKRLVNPIENYNGVFIPAWMARRKELKPESKLLYSLLVFKSTEGECIASLKSLASSLGIAASEVLDCIKELAHHDLIAYEFLNPVDHRVQIVFYYHTWMDEVLS